MMEKLPKFCPMGRLSDLASRADADLIAYTVGAGFAADYAIKRYASRAALEAFCRDGSKHHALVKRRVSASMLVNRNVERALT
jgi:hypothetical protein